MYSMSKSELLRAACKSTNQWGMYVSFGSDDPTELVKAAPYFFSLSDEIRSDGCGFLFFSKEEELNTYYNQTIGDDGPTAHNSYNGPARVYAMTCGPDGKIRTENT